MPRSVLARSILSAGALLALGAALRAWGDTLDDAFITFRSVHNFVAGDGLTFNPGLRPVESFSSPLFTLLLVPFAACGVPLPWAARLFGLVGIALALVSLRGLARHAKLEELDAAVVLGTTLGSTALVYYGLTGLETGLYSGLLVAALARTAAGKSLDALATLMWAFAALARPEAPLVVLLALAVLVPPPLAAANARGVAALFTTLALFVAARFAYYGELVPNTFFAKPMGGADHDPATSGLVAGPLYFLRFVLACGLVLPLGSALAAFGLRMPAASERQRVLRGALAMLGGGTAFAIYAGGDWMPMGRYLVPYLPLVMLAGVLGLRLVAERWNVRPVLALGVGALAALIGSADALIELHLHRREYPYHVMGSADSIAAIERMRSVLPARSSLVAFRVGALGDVGDYVVIDLLGLLDRRIAAVVSAAPGYHPQRSRMGDDVPELRTLVRDADPDAVLLVTYADGELDDTIALYDLTFRFAEAYPIGADQRWALYLRER